MLPGKQLCATARGTMGGRLAYPEGVLDAEELLSHHTQHLNVDAVELIKAGPGARLSQAGKELAHEAVVQPLTTVEHHTVHAQCLTQVLLATQPSN